MAAPLGLGFVWIPGAERDDLLTDDDWQRVEIELLANPQAGQVIRGLGGARTLRIRLAGRGKSGGARTIYLYLVRAAKVYFLLTYAKNEQEDLSSSDRAALRTIIAQLREEG